MELPSSYVCAQGTLCKQCENPQQPGHGGCLWLAHGRMCIWHFRGNTTLLWGRAWHCAWPASGTEPAPQPPRRPHPRHTYARALLGLRALVLGMCAGTMMYTGNAQQTDHMSTRWPWCLPAGLPVYNTTIQQYSHVRH